MEKQTSRWNAFYDNTKQLPPHELLIQALDFVSEYNVALDLGAGAMRDTKQLLKIGFKKVIAVDAEPINQQNEIFDDRLEIVINSFESYNFPKNKFNLINAQFSLPFILPTSFNEVFSRLKKSLKTGGVFVGQLFGKEDEWNSNPKMTFHSSEEVQQLLQDLEILYLQEKGQDGFTVAGTPKYWHIFYIIARK